MRRWFRSRPAARSRSIDEALWREATAEWLFMRGLPEESNRRLKALSERFLAMKHYSGTHGLEVDARMQVEIAAQACILVLELGIEWYEGWSEVIVYPSQFAPEREEMDEDGVVHLTNDPMAGEAWLGGPVVLSYEDVALAADAEQRVAGYNVVIHEFAHQLDQEAGYANGAPELATRGHYARWSRVLGEEYERLRASAEAGEPSLLDDYGATDPAEFFAVLAEVFFEQPQPLREENPLLYDELSRFFRVDPASWRPPAIPG